MTSHPGAHEPADTTEETAAKAQSLLDRIGGFIEPLTRFGRSRLGLARYEHRSVRLALRRIFSASLVMTSSDGAGALPPGVEDAGDADAAERASAAQLAAARVLLPRRLADWAHRHAEDARATPSWKDCFAAPSPIGHASPCGPCNGRGRVNCSACLGAKGFACKTCEGRGALGCRTCGRTGKLSCRMCGGMGAAIHESQREVKDEATGEVRIEHAQGAKPCKACGRTGAVTCTICEGRGELSCHACAARGSVECASCAGAGDLQCDACRGCGQRHRIMTLTCAIEAALDLAPDNADPDAAARLQALTADRLLDLAAARRTTTEAAGETLRQETWIDIPVTRVGLAIGEAQFVLCGYGPQQETFDYGGLGDKLLEEDLAALKAANAAAGLALARTSSPLPSALGAMLASQANAAIAEEEKDRAEIAVKDYRNAVSASYARQAWRAMHKGLARAYWSQMARGPLFILAAPLFAGVIDRLAQGLGAGWSAALALLLAASGGLGAAWAGHRWTERRLQASLAPGGAPRIRALLRRHKLTQAFMILAAASAIGLGLAGLGLARTLAP